MIENVIKFYSLFFILLSLPFHVFSEAQDIEKIEEWKQLLHFSDNKSTITSPSFFLNENGAEDPISELYTTIDLLNSKDGGVIAANYPARYLWLHENGYSIPEFDLKSFTELNDYIESFHKDSLYLVFASEQINSPASSFGHLLLVFSDDNISMLAADTIHFAAETEIVGDSFFKYAFNGLTGNYDGYFFRTPFFIIKNAYNLNDQRDLNFYKLDLDSKQILFLIYHLYELRKAKYGYYFLTENCAYQIDALLKVAYGSVEDSYRYHFPIVPIDVLNAYQWNVSEQFVFPATLKRAQSLFDDMSEQSKEIYREVQKEGLKPDWDLPDKVKEVLYIEAEYQFRCLGNVSKDYEEIMLLQFPHTFYSPSLLPPSARNNKHLFGLGTYKDKSHEGLVLGYQLIGRDIYEIQNYKMQESDVAFFDVELKLRDYKDLSFQRLDLLRTKSLFNRGRLSSLAVWSADLGINRQNLDNRVAGNFSLAAGLGNGSDKIGFCCLAGIGVQNTAQEGKLYIKPSLDLLFYPSDVTKTGASILKKYCLHGTYSEAHIFALRSFDGFSVIAECSLSNSDITGNSFTLGIRI